ncbi:SusD/RagB family nutrient-binding outer membrane lipoprotein [Pedobacter sp. AW31-3R]|uniref:SusD/RagB family nutrient-binding outer membrane lipoprotein n=1 Tax=Pedobacter sp. AW31-3R TaxID=3445781 RepID=UPI003FA047FC
MKKFSVITGALLMLLSSCGKFEELNVNPNNPATVPAEMLLPPIISGAVGSMNSSGTRAGQYVQHLSWLGGTSEEDGRYNLTGASYREEWNGPMRLIKDVNQLKEIGTSTNLNQYVAVAAVLKVYILSLMSDAYGDIPYNEAGMGNVSGMEFAHYQSQQEVYTLMLNDLESANQLFKNLPSGTVVNRDILFSGSIARWRKFANSLKVRILMRQSAKTNVNAAVAAIFNNPAEYPVFENVSDQATLVYNNGTDLYYWFIQNPAADGSGVDFAGNTRVSNVMVNLLSSKNDPRLPIYAAPTRNSFLANRTNSATPLVYRGQRAGFSTAEQNADYAQTGLNKDDYSVIGKRIRKENRAFLMTYAELMLLKTEAIQREMGVSGTAAATYLIAIKASLDKWPAVGSADQVETPFISEAQKTAYLAQPAVALSTTNPIKQIAEQLYIDSYLNGFEGWAGWRRLGFPELVPGPTVLSPVPVRYVYSDNEQNNPNLILWVQQTMGGTMPTHNTKVWFQP